MLACSACHCCAAMFMTAGEDGTVRQVDLRENGRAMTLIGEPVLSCSGRHVIQPQGTLRPMHSACLRHRNTPLAVHALAARNC